jgi:outer membrane lipoprotein SlyB
MGLKTLSAVALSTLVLVGCDPKPTQPTATSDATATAPQPVAAVTQQTAQPIGQPVPSTNVVYPQQTATQAPAPVVTRPMAQNPAPQSTYVQAPVQIAQAQQVPAAPNPALHGEVRGIEAIRDRPQGTGTGAIIGGVLGAVVGNRFGSGTGRAAMTVLGGAGGAVAGNNVERNMNEGVVGYRLIVRLDNGQQRTYQEPRLNGLQIGDRIRLDHGHVRRA